ncbi:WD40/YVTN/BNR-like repeat-containing protein [Kribbella sp. DT2]|uniref:WD40/YVTN/BNR-like repeat-containing protein n=1 Tax=Kribbella sp. DT2 TaxID=3393427 RepID=UPI003CF64334
MGVAVVCLGVIAAVALRGTDQKEEPVAVNASASIAVGGDLHAVVTLGSRRFVSGHDGAGFSDVYRSWQAIPTLGGKDAMGWAAVPGRILVGGHEGLYLSTDEGRSFEAADTNLPVTDVHALGAAKNTVYAASPQSGLFRSDDSGNTFVRVSDTAASFMGTIAVDPGDPEHLLAPDMRAGVAQSKDGGRTWTALGGPEGTMSVAWNPKDLRQIAAVGMDGLMVSRDGGVTWAKLDTEGPASAVAFDGKGNLLLAVLDGARAEVYVADGLTAPWTRI